ncbi:MAG: hypothetical protein E7022_06155 [Desulfovibrio desulfuricans]|nr:hypothetical protein [Desulfovibrio desulfuricans]
MGDGNRLDYSVRGNTIHIVTCRNHYEN